MLMENDCMWTQNIGGKMTHNDKSKYLQKYLSHCHLSLCIKWLFSMYEISRNRLKQLKREKLHWRFSTWKYKLLLFHTDSLLVWKMCFISSYCWASGYWCSYKTLGTHPIMQCHNLDDQNPQLHHYANLNIWPRLKQKINNVINMM